MKLNASTRVRPLVEIFVNLLKKRAKIKINYRIVGRKVEHFKNCTTPLINHRPVSREIKKFEVASKVLIQFMRNNKLPVAFAFKKNNYNNYENLIILFSSLVLC